MICRLGHRTRFSWCPYCPTFLEAALDAVRKWRRRR